MHPEQPLHIVTKEVSGIWELIFFFNHVEYIDIALYCMTLYVIVYKNQCQFIRMSWIYCASLGWFPKAPKRHEPQTFVTAVLTHEIPRAPSGLGWPGWPPVATEAVDQCLCRTAARNLTEERIMFQQVGVLPKSVWIRPKIRQERSEMQNSLGWYAASWFCNAAQGFFMLCRCV